MVRAFGKLEQFTKFSLVISVNHTERSKTLRPQSVAFDSCSPGAFVRTSYLHLTKLESDIFAKHGTVDAFCAHRTQC